VGVNCAGTDRNTTPGVDTVTFIVREAAKPEVVDVTPNPAMPPDPIVGVNFKVSVDVEDNVEDLRSGILYIIATPEGPVSVVGGPLKFRVPSGVPLGPPTDAAGPETWEHEFTFACTADEDAKIVFTTEDAAGNVSDGKVLAVNCVL